MPCPFTGTTTPTENALAPVDQLLTDVTTSTDGCVDIRHVHVPAERGTAPSYRVGYEAGPFSNSAGEPVTPAGTVFLTVRFEPAWIADLSHGVGTGHLHRSPDHHPDRLEVGARLALSDAFEAIVGWVIGLDAEQPFAVAASPGQVVIKIG